MQLPLKLLTLLSNSLKSQNCPTTSVSFVPVLNLTAFVSHPWYTQEQQAVIYQQPKDLFCTVDHYTLNKESNEVNGKETEATLHGLIDDVNVPSHWSVGFQWMPKFIRGPYWVIATYPEGMSDEYEWAIVTGGPPSHVGKDGKCKPGTFVNYSGLWLFTKERFPGSEVMDSMKQVLRELDYDLSILIKVEHEGCKYPF